MVMRLLSGLSAGIWAIRCRRTGLLTQTPMPLPEWIMKRAETQANGLPLMATIGLTLNLQQNIMPAAELKSGIQGYEKSREDDIAEAGRLIQNVVSSEAGSTESSPYFVEVSEYGTNPLNPAAKPYPWNLAAGVGEMETSELN